MKKSGDMRFKQAIDGSRRALIFFKSDARKQHGSHKSIKASYLTTDSILTTEPLLFCAIMKLSANK